MKRICCSLSRISLTESARETISPPRFGFFVSHARDCTTFTLHDLTDFYIERVTAHGIKIIDHSCFHNHWPASKTKLNENISESKGAPWCLGAACVFCVYWGSALIRTHPNSQQWNEHPSSCHREPLLAGRNTLLYFAWLHYCHLVVIVQWRGTN